MFVIAQCIVIIVLFILKVYVCASHGLFTGLASNLIDVSLIEKVLIIIMIRIISILSLYSNIVLV